MKSVNNVLDLPSLQKVIFRGESFEECQLAQFDSRDG